MTTACRRAPRDKKNRENKQQTDPRGGDKKEKQHKLRMNIRNACILVETQTLLEQNTPQDSKIIRI